MSVYVGIDVHRKRSQVAVVTEDGQGAGQPERAWTRAWHSGLPLPAVSRQVVADSLAVIDAIAPTIEQLDREVHARAKTHPRVKVLTALPGVGEFTAMVLLAEIGDIARFSNARKLASWVGLTPTVRGSGPTMHHGHISKQCSPYVRWVLGQAAYIANGTRARRHLPGDRRTARPEDRHQWRWHASC